MDSDGIPAKKKIKRSSDLLNITGNASNILVIKDSSPTVSPNIHRVKECETIAGVKQFLDFANCQQQQEPTVDLNIEAVPDGEPYIEMTLGLVPLGEEDSDRCSDTSLSDSDSSDSSCENLQAIKLPDGRYLQTHNQNKTCNSYSLIEEIEKK
ncbi:uncharacterized protein [Dysidea avara]|uniref:uncharacterized protein n=1 Tax=Dysidea avara TaxID=196820 RepID=UPI00333095B4